MEYRQLGRSDLQVSQICLGSMMWGSQNTEQEGHQQLDYAVAQGVNFIDTAEIYAIPPQPETQGATEEVIGNWLAKRGNREQVIIATKVSGRSPNQWLRNEDTRLNRQQIESAIDCSLKRLKTDYVDLYQLHWPDRVINNFGFGSPNYEHYDIESVAIEETLSVLADLVSAGKVRHIGLSNETPWGLSRFLYLAEVNGLPRVVSVQNAYNLLNRSYELGLSEFFYQEGVGLLAYSPLAQGVLTGKYLQGRVPEGSRLDRYDRLSRYQKEATDPAVQRYADLAEEEGVDMVDVALAFVNRKPFVTSNIIGATSMEQLKRNIDSVNVELSESVLASIEKIHLISPNPCP
jgi:aryl-alcohol dehydrogenase-like predicted oxidoreductase